MITLPAALLTMSNFEDESTNIGVIIFLAFLIVPMLMCLALTSSSAGVQQIIDFINEECDSHENNGLCGFINKQRCASMSFYLNFILIFFILILF